MFVIFVYDVELVGCGIIIVFDVMCVGLIFLGKGWYLKYVCEFLCEMMELCVEGVLKISYFLYFCVEVCFEIFIEEFSEFDENDCVGIVSFMDYMSG